MDPDQSPESVNAQACIPPAASSDPTSAPVAPAPVSVAPGPVDSPAQSANPILAPAPSGGGEGEHEGGGESENPGAEAVEKGITGIGWADKALGAAEGVLGSVGGEIAEHAAPAMQGLGAFVGPLGFLAGGAEVAQGVAHGDATEVMQGGAGMVGGGASTLGAMSAAAGGESVLGVAGGAAAETAAGEGALMTAGGAVAGTTLAAGAAAAGVGIAAGTGMAHAADSDLTRTGVWGQDESGKNNSAMDWGAGWGTSVDKALGNKDPSILGGIAAGAGGIVGGVAGTVQAGWNGLTSW